MKLLHHVRQERSGLMFSTIDQCQEEERQGHTVCIKAPNGDVLYGNCNQDFDVDIIHSQLDINCYHNDRPKFLWCHGEPISSVANGVSMRALIDLASHCEAFLAMRREEVDYWSLIKRTYCVRKGIDLNRFKPLEVKPHDDEDKESKLSGSPAVLYFEHWRGTRNPLCAVAAMKKVWRKYPEARLHLYNCTDQKMLDTFKSLVNDCKLWPFVRSIQGSVNDPNLLLNRCDIVVSCLQPFYARSIEAFGAGKALVCPGYTDPEYPFTCNLDPQSMADAICAAHESKFDFREWGEKKHDVADMVKESIKIYERYL